MNEITASSSISFVCRPYTVQGKPYFDGALGDPVPVRKAFELGCDRVLLIAPDDTCEVDTLKKDKKALKLGVLATSSANHCLIMHLETGLAEIAAGLFCVWK